MKMKNTKEIKRLAEIAMLTNTKHETENKLREIGFSDDEIGLFNFYCYWAGSVSACAERDVKKGNVKIIYC